LDFGCYQKDREKGSSPRDRISTGPLFLQSAFAEDPDPEGGNKKAVDEVLRGKDELHWTH